MANKKILIVDDEKNLTLALDSFFRAKGYDIYIANSGEAALDFLKRQKIDLLILDLNMPGVDGVEVAETVKKEYTEAKILMLTAYPEEYKDRLTSVKVEEIITKPFGIMMLINKAQGLLGEEVDLKPTPEPKPKAHRPVKVLFVDPAMDYVLRDYVLPYIKLSWGENIEVESVSPTPPSAAREKTILFKPDIVLLSAILTKQAEELSVDITKNIYRPKEAIIYNVPDEKIVKESPVNAYYFMQKPLTDPDYLNRLNDLIKEIALKHNLIDEDTFRREKPKLPEPADKFTIEDIDDFVKEAISKELEIKKEKLKDSASFEKDLGVDSLETVELTMALEDTFGLELPDEDIAKLRTVKEAVEYIKKRVDLRELARRKKSTYKILIIDDQKGMCKFLENYFQAKGYEALSATEANTALSMVEKEKPDAVLLDVRMPDVDGIELLKRIKKLDPSTKVIMVSVALEKKDEASRLGADAFISKPFPITYLEKTVVGKIKELIA